MEELEDGRTDRVISIIPPPHQKKTHTQKKKLWLRKSKLSTGPAYQGVLLNQENTLQT